MGSDVMRKGMLLERELNEKGLSQGSVEVERGFAIRFLDLTQEREWCI